MYFELVNEYETELSEHKTPNVWGENCRVGKLASVAGNNVNIGNNVIIEDFVQIGENVSIGDNTIIRAGAKIGVQAFNIYQYNGQSKQLYHGGKTIVGQNVLVGQNTVIEQALYHYGVTEVRDNCALDANVLIGHNSALEENIEVTAGACIAGYARIGKNSVIRLGALIGNGLTVGENSHIGMGSVVMRDVKPNSRTIGNPACDLKNLE